MTIANFDLNAKKTFIIAELSANHNGSLDLAKKTIEAAARSGADAIKLQTYTANTLTIDCDREYFQIQQDTLWDGETLYHLYEKAYTPWEWHEELFACAKANNLICFSSPFDKSAVDLLETLNTPCYKIASFEITDLELIKYAASKKKPIIISTGIATQENIEDALEACRSVGNEEIVLLKCTSAYPAPLEEANLKTIQDIAARYKVEVGFSDHTLGITAPITAVALGAKVIEKHFILDHALGGVDEPFSLDEQEFKTMVSAVRETEQLLGEVSYKITPKIEKSRTFARSLFIVEDVKKGEKLTRENIRSIRPGFGMSPKYLNDVLGKTFKANYQRGEPLQWELIE